MFGGDVARVPEAALSMGMATILQARAVVLMATGAGKAGVVQAMMDGHDHDVAAGVVPAAAPEGDGDARSRGG